MGIAGVLESKVRQAWEDYKTKNKADLASLLADALSKDVVHLFTHRPISGRFQIAHR
jgi:hypothetical protein